MVDGDGRVVGMLTETDFLRRLQAGTFLELLLRMVENSCEVSHRCHETPVHEAMTAPAVTVRPEAGFRETMAAFRGHPGRSMPVADAAGTPARAAPAQGLPRGPGPGGAPVSLPEYFRKMGGTTRGSPPRVSNAEIAWSWVGAFLGIAAAGLASQAIFAGTDLTLMVGSLGASAVLLFGAPRSPLAQPRNLVGGHVLSASSAWPAGSSCTPTRGSPARSPSRPPSR